MPKGGHLGCEGHQGTVLGTHHPRHQTAPDEYLRMEGVTLSSKEQVSSLKVKEASIYLSGNFVSSFRLGGARVG